MDLGWTHAAVEQLLDLARMDWRQAERIQRAILQHARDEAGDVKKLKGHPDEWRLRVGDWRVVFKYEGQPRRLNVLEVVNRRDAYD